MEYGTETDLDLGLLDGDGDLFDVAGVLDPPLQWLITCFFFVGL